MRRRTRALLAVLGLVLLIVALAALLYAVRPSPIVTGVFPIAPTLLVPPGGAP